MSSVDQAEADERWFRGVDEPDFDESGDQPRPTDAEAIVYEIINPSDRYTLAAEDRAAAAVVCICLGGGQYGLEVAGSPDAPGVPIMLFWDEQDLAEWWRTEFGGTMGEYIDAHAADIATVFDSVMIGGVAQRAAYFRALELIDDEVKRQAWKEEWLDRRRSSMNNIGARAFEYAKRFRANATHEEASHA